MFQRNIPDALAVNTGKRIYNSVPEAIEGENLGWGVDKRPLFVRLPERESPVPGIETPMTARMKRADNLYGIVRADLETTLGVASSRYEAIDNATALRPFDVLAREANLSGIRAGSTRGGAHVWASGVLGDPIKVAGYTVTHAIISRFWHDGTGGVGYFSSFLRDSCCNQIRGILNDAMNKLRAFTQRYRHTASGLAAVGDMALDIKGILNVRAAFIAKAEALHAKPFSRVEMERLAAELAPPPDPEMATDRENRAWERRFEALMGAWNAPDLADAGATQWRAINAVADYEQHLVRVTGTPERRQDTLLERGLAVGSLVRKAELLLTA